MCSNVTIETYSREIERYGGNKLISYYEAYFCQESEDILSLIEKKKMRYDEDLDFEDELPVEDNAVEEVTEAEANVTTEEDSEE